MNNSNKLYTLIRGYQITQAISTAAQLKIADYLREGATHVSELAKQTAVNENKLYRLLRTLAGLELFQETEPYCFACTPMGALLDSQSENSLHAFAARSGQENYQAWGEFRTGLSNNSIPFEEKYGMPFFDYLANKPQQRSLFHQALVEHMGIHLEAILKHFNFNGCQKILDIGGGHGILLRSILSQYPNIIGTVFDQAHIVEDAQSLCEHLEDRLSFMSGNFFGTIPSGYDTMVLKFILHDWNDAQCKSILDNCRQGMDENTQLLIIETIVPEDAADHPAKWHDLHMLTLFDGKERTQHEFAQLLTQSGLKIDKIIHTNSDGLLPLSILVAKLA